jgi:hypothetical protein
VTAKQIGVKRYVVKLSDDERERLNTMVRAGKHPAWRLIRARILVFVHKAPHLLNEFSAVHHYG